MDIVSQRRGKKAAILGLVFQVVLSTVMLVVWLQTDSLSAMAAFWLLLGGAALWLMAAVLFYCRQLQQQEVMELEEIATAPSSGAIFDAQERALRPAANRLTWILRWIVPIFTLLFATYNIALSSIGLRYFAQIPGSMLAHAPTDAITASVVFCIIGAFLGFMLSRYSTGMGSQETYRPLRAAGSYLLTNVLVVLGVTASLAFAYYGRTSVDLVVAFIVPAVQLVLAVELAMNLLLDIYRPRVPGQEQRMAFDSRLFNLVADPGRVGHSIAETLNYQFGFEVSKTWFYQLLSRAMLPLLAAGVLILLGLTSIVIVPQGEKAVIFHYGKITRQVEAGQYLKWPWPIDQVDRFNVQAVHDVYLGAGEERNPTIINGHEIALWSEEHGQREEKDFLVAVHPESMIRDNPNAPNVPAVNIIKLVVLVQYRIKDVVRYGFIYDDPNKQLELMAYREMVRYLASATLMDRIDSSDRPQAIMTFGRQAAADELKRRIQKVVEDDLGVEIVNVGIQGIHPPQEAGDKGEKGKPESVAKAYEVVMEAERKMDEMRYGAQGRANEILTRAAGNPGQAMRLALAIRKQRELESLSRAKKEQKLGGRIDETIAWAREEVRHLREEISHDQLMGKVPPPSGSQPTSAAAIEDEFQERLELRDQYLQYIAQLEDIKAGRPGKLTEALALANAAVEDLFKSSSGQPAALEADAQAQRWTTELGGRAKAENFQRELAAYRSAPNIYMLDRYLDVYDQVMPGLPKYVFGVDRNKLDLRVDLRTEAQPMEGAMERGAGNINKPQVNKEQ